MLRLSHKGMQEIVQSTPTYTINDFTFSGDHIPSLVQSHNLGSRMKHIVIMNFMIQNVLGHIEDFSKQIISC